MSLLLFFDKYFLILFQAENEPEPECEPIEDPPPELLDNQTVENKEVRKETRISTVVVR